MEYISIVYGIWCALLSLYIFILCFVDKRAAKKEKRRIPEKKLIIPSIIGGGVGLLLGMYTFRHKTKHWYFVLIAWVTTALQIFLMIFLLIKFPTF